MGDLLSFPKKRATLVKDVQGILKYYEKICKQMNLSEKQINYALSEIKPFAEKIFNLTVVDEGMGFLNDIFKLILVLATTFDSNEEAFLNSIKHNDNTVN
ncbi:MAG TPA: hypothetical protein ENJ60_04270 [Aeromonadales bacterium]|nr:hypothetical protein [Aeromonadales bacterium]